MAACSDPRARRSLTISAAVMVAPPWPPACKGRAGSRARLGARARARVRGRVKGRAKGTVKGTVKGRVKGTAVMEPSSSHNHQSE